MDLYEELKAKKIGGAASGGFTPTEQQLAAMNSGITSTDVAQINTNKNSITDIKDGTSINSFGDVEDALDDKADKSATYTKTEVDTALDSKANTSDIPTVPIAAIQKNGTGITPVSGTVNITVPTTATDVSALPDTTKYATTLSLTINSSTFVMTGQLKDQNGDNLGTAQTIDLPLESVVVGGSYNSQTKKVVLTLQNGNTIEFSVADLVSGLQTELSETNKLNPAYINYDSTHRAVSDAEKSAWNDKQNALTTAQLAAVNSGIDSTKVAQIETNKNNISSLTANGGGKNKLQITATSTAEMTINDDKSVSITVNATTTKQYNLTGWISNNYVGMKISGMTVNSNVSTGYFMSVQYSNNGSSWANETNIATIGSATILNYPFIRIAIVVRENNNLNDVLFKPMISADGGDYQPYAMSNAEITAWILAHS